mgnify:CR=1 FL=1
MCSSDLKLHRAEAGQLARFADGIDFSGFAWAASAERLVELGKSLTRGRALEKVDPPASFRASLRPYQADGLAWLDFLRDAGFGGVLADDMGLGKTVQVLALLLLRRDVVRAAGIVRRPSLVVVPKSLVFNWIEEARRFAPGLRVLNHTGNARLEAAAAVADHDIVITTYGTLRRDIVAHRETEFD